MEGDLSAQEVSALQDDLLLVFGRVPTLGVGMREVISRYGAQAAFKLQRSLLDISIEHADPLQVHKAFRYPVGSPVPTLPAGWEVGPHESGSEGELITRALAQAFLRGFARVVLFYADCPSLVAEFLEIPFEALEGGAQVVLGPTPRGGLYLVGAQRPAQEFFQGLPWGTPGLFETAQARAKEQGLKLAVLPHKSAVETPEDWVSVSTEGWIPPPPPIAGGAGRPEG